jgi:outer membrane protein assembly factor BamB
MMPVRRLALVIFMSGALAACQSSSSEPSCSFNDPAVLAASSWPKFRHDRCNPGSITLSSDALPQVPAEALWVFPPNTSEGVGPFSASPALNQNDELLYIGSTDGTLYVINTGNTTGCAAVPPAGTLATSFTLTAQYGISSTALLAVRDGKDAIFVGGDDGRLYGLASTGVAQASYWPFVITGAVSASPNISVSKGIIYGGSLQALFFGVCPNGIADFSVSTVGIGSSPAVGPDGTVYFGANDGQLRSIESTGTFNWAFSTSGPILTAPVVQADGDTTTAVYVASGVGATGGRIFKVASTGQLDSTFNFAGPNGAPVGAILSSPALAGSRLYVGSVDGNIYAFDSETGQFIWAVETGAEVLSSPAVATATGTSPVVVIGSNDGNVYFVTDDGTSAPPVRTFPIGAPVRSSPAIDQFGTVYVGADDGHVYAIGAPPPCG